MRLRTPWPTSLPKVGPLPAARLGRVPGLMMCVMFGLALVATPPARAEDDAAGFVRFEEEPTATCVARSGVQVQVRSTHPSRAVRVWLDRYHMGVGTGDRSRSDLRPGAEPEALGCSRSLTGPQEWRLVRAQFID